MNLTPEIEAKAQRAARDYYLNNHLGHGKNDPQDAEWAAVNVLHAAGFSSEEANRLGCAIAARQVEIIDDAGHDRHESEDHDHGGPERFRDFRALSP